MGMIFSAFHSAYPVHPVSLPTSYSTFPLPGDMPDNFDDVIVMVQSKTEVELDW